MDLEVDGGQFHEVIVVLKLSSIAFHAFFTLATILFSISRRVALDWPVCLVACCTFCFVQNIYF